MQKDNFLKIYFFPSAITESNNLDPVIQTINNFSICKEKILQFIRPSLNSLYNCHNPKGINFFTRLRLDLSYS